MVTYLTRTDRVVEIKELGRNHTGEKFLNNSKVIYWLYGFAGVASLTCSIFGITNNLIAMVGVPDKSRTSNSGFAHDTRRFSQLTRSMGVGVGRRWPRKD